MKRCDNSACEVMVSNWRSYCCEQCYESHRNPVGDAAQAVKDAVNQGIDAYLEVCYAPVWGDKYEVKDKMVGDTLLARKLHCKVSKNSLPVLLRRLYETEGELQEEACNLANDILSTLGLADD